MTFWRWLLNGADTLTLSKSWLANTERLALYEAFTERQRWSRVEKDTAYFARQAFWQRVGQRGERKPTLKWRAR